MGSTKVNLSYITIHKNAKPYHGVFHVDEKKFQIFSKRKERSVTNPLNSQKTICDDSTESSALYILQDNTGHD